RSSLEAVDDQIHVGAAHPDQWFRPERLRLGDYTHIDLRTPALESGGKWWTYSPHPGMRCFLAKRLEMHLSSRTEVRRRYTSEDVHRALFPDGVPRKAARPRDVKDGIRAHIRKRHARV